MIELKLTKEEFAALNELVYENPCASGCVWKKPKNKNCDNCDFSESLLNGTDFSYTKLAYCTFVDSDMAGCIFQGADVEESD